MLEFFFYDLKNVETGHWFWKWYSHGKEILQEKDGIAKDWLGKKLRFDHFGMQLDINLVII